MTSTDWSVRSPSLGDGPSGRAVERRSCRCSTRLRTARIGPVRAVCAHRSVASGQLQVANRDHRRGGRELEDPVGGPGGVDRGGAHAGADDLHWAGDVQVALRVGVLVSGLVADAERVGAGREQDPVAPRARGALVAPGVVGVGRADRLAERAARGVDVRVAEAGNADVGGRRGTRQRQRRHDCSEDQPGCAGHGTTVPQVGDPVKF